MIAGPIAHGHLGQLEALDIDVAAVALQADVTLRPQQCRHRLQAVDLAETGLELGDAHLPVLKVHVGQEDEVKPRQLGHGPQGKSACPCSAALAAGTKKRFGPEAVGVVTRRTPVSGWMPARKRPRIGADQQQPSDTSTGRGLHRRSRGGCAWTRRPREDNF